MKAIPTGLAPGSKVQKDIPKGGMLTGENVAPDATKLVYKLRQMQDAMLTTGQRQEEKSAG